MFDFVAPADFLRFLWGFNRQRFQIFNELVRLKIPDTRCQFRFKAAGNRRFDLPQFLFIGAKHGELRDSALQTPDNFASFIILRVGEGYFARDDEVASFKPHVNARLSIQNRFFNRATETELFRLLLDSSLDRLMFRPASARTWLARLHAGFGGRLRSGF